MPGTTGKRGRGTAGQSGRGKIGHSARGAGGQPGRGAARHPVPPLVVIFRHELSLTPNHNQAYGGTVDGTSATHFAPARRSEAVATAQGRSDGDGAFATHSSSPLPSPQGASAQGGGDQQQGISVGLSEELQCPVCLDMFSRATTLGCGHTFCADCLQETRNKSGNTCPLCRAAISAAIRSVTLDNVIRNVLANQ